MSAAPRSPVGAAAGTYAGTDGVMTVVAVVLLGVLVLASMIGLHRRRRQKARRAGRVRVTGRVVDEVDTGSGGKDWSTSAVVVAFRTLDGQEVHGVPPGGWDLGLPVTGRAVPVWYDPADPRRFETQVHRVDRAGTVAFTVAAVSGVLLLVVLLTG